MPGLRRSVARSAIAVAVTALAAGCGSGSSGQPSLTVYLSAPLSGPAAGDGADVTDGARRALADAGGSAGGTDIRIVVLDDADAGGATDALAGANARRATEDSTAIAYVGELDSGTTRTSLPITNEAGMLQVSPGASAVDLTRAAPGSDQIPEGVQPSGSRTFGRVIPSDTVQGAAAAVAMNERHGIGRIRAVGAEGAYSSALIEGFESVSSAPEVAPGERADAIYAVSPVPRAGLPEGVGADVARYGADAQIVGSPPETRMPRGSVLISAAMAPSQLPQDQSPDAVGGGRFAAYGYEAMAVVLDSIDRAGDPLDRGSVVDAFFATTDRKSVLGTYSIDDVGDTTLGRVGVYDARRGGRLAAARSPIETP
jgi:branched-chain amino acid transport system substrate-binding protein